MNLGLNPGDKVALVGANCSGKSTLLRILVGQEAPDEGTITHSVSDEVGYLPQFVQAFEGDTIEDVITSSVAGLKFLEHRMRELEQRMADFVDDDEVLANLGVGYLTRDRKVSGLSGGEKARVGLAVLLLAARISCCSTSRPMISMIARWPGWRAT